MKYRFLGVVAVVGFLLPGCVTHDGRTIYHNRDSEAGRAMADLDAASRVSQDEEFKSKANIAAREFITYAQLGKVDEMLALTSSLTLRNTGKESMKNIYAGQIVPALKGAVVHWNAEGKPVFDQGYTGLIVSGFMRGTHTSPIYVYVFKEQGRFVISVVTTKKES